MLRLDPLWRWLLGAVLALPLCLGLWWWLLREPLVSGLAQAVDFLLPWLWADTVLGLGRQGRVWLLVSVIPPLTEPPQMFMALPLSFNRAAVLFPLFWGLTLATPGRGLLRRLLVGTLILLPIALLMALLAAQFQLVLYRTHLPMLTDVPPANFALALPDGAFAQVLWGLGRQLAVLVLPIAAPLLLWLSLHGSFWRRVLLGGWLQRQSHSAPAGASAPIVERTGLGTRVLTLALLAVLLVGCHPQPEPYRTALRYLLGNDPVTAARLLSSLANNGYAPAQFRLGLLYQIGLGVPVRPRSAVYWFSKAAQQGEIGSQYRLADAYQRGYGAPHTPELAVQGFLGLAEQHYAPAQYRLALAYAAGTGVARDPVAAVAWLKRAADGGHTDAARQLAQAYRTGAWGLTPDPRQAEAWERKTQPGRF